MVLQLFWLSSLANQGPNDYQGTPRSKQYCRHNLCMALLGPAYSLMWPATRTSSDNCKYILPNLWQALQLLNTHWTFLNTVFLVYIIKIRDYNYGQWKYIAQGVRSQSCTHKIWTSNIENIFHYTQTTCTHNTWTLYGKHISSYIIHETHVLATHGYLM